MRNERRETTKEKKRNERREEENLRRREKKTRPTIERMKRRKKKEKKEDLSKKIFLFVSVRLAFSPVIHLVSTANIDLFSPFSLLSFLLIEICCHSFTRNQTTFERKRNVNLS